VLYACIACYTFGYGISLPNITTAGIEVRPETAGTAAAALAFAQQGFSAAGSLIVSLVEAGSGTGMVWSFTAMVAAGLLCVIPALKRPAPPADRGAR
jgi:hypothetical protein